MSASPEKTSYRKLIDAKIIKRTDNGMCARFEQVRIVPGFNLRDMSAEDYEADIEALMAHKQRGGQVPDIEVTLSADGLGVDVVDGHRRFEADRRLAALGVPIEWVPIKPFIGNDLDRLQRIMTSNEGRKLTALEVAQGYKRMTVQFHLSPDDIAHRVGKTRQHVDQMLILASAPHQVHELVKAGDVSATEAVKVVREHGAGAGEHLADAKAKTGGKVTAKALKEWTPPPKYTTPLVKNTKAILAHIAPDILARAGSVATFEKEDEIVQISVSMRTLFNLVQNVEVIEEAREDKAEKQRAKADKAKQLALPETDGA